MRAAANAAAVAGAHPLDDPVLDQQLRRGGLGEDVDASLLGFLGEKARQLGDRGDVVAVVAEVGRHRLQRQGRLLRFRVRAHHPGPPRCAQLDLARPEGQEGPARVQVVAVLMAGGLRAQQVLEGARGLVVEDELMVAWALEDMLAELGCTVVGPAANKASRLETMCKVLGRTLVISADLARLVDEPLVSLGFHDLDGVREPDEVLTLLNL